MLSDEKVKEIFNYFGVETNENADGAMIMINDNLVPITNEIRNDVFIGFNEIPLEDIKSTGSIAEIDKNIKFDFVEGKHEFTYLPGKLSVAA